MGKHFPALPTPALLLRHKSHISSWDIISLWHLNVMTSSHHSITCHFVSQHNTTLQYLTRPQIHLMSSTLWCLEVTTSINSCVGGGSVEHDVTALGVRRLHLLLHLGFVGTDEDDGYVSYVDKDGHHHQPVGKKHELEKRVSRRGGGLPPSLVQQRLPLMTREQNWKS